MVASRARGLAKALSPALGVVPPLALWLALAPDSADLTAQLYRAELFEREGWVLINTEWYAGILNPGYSLVFPPLGALVGVREVGAASVVASAVLFALLAEELVGRRAVWGAGWFALGAGTLLFTGRLTFALGLAFGLAALLAAERLRPWPAALLALASAAAAPLAALFVALVGGARWLAEVRARELWRRPRAWPGASREGVPVVLGAALGLGILALWFPQGGAHPFAFSSYVAVPLACAALLLLVPTELRALRTGVWLYLALATLAFVVAEPVGGNSVRLGALAAGPVLVLAVAGRPLAAGEALRPFVLALVLVPLAYWQWVAAARDHRDARDDPSLAAAFHQPLVEQLERRTGSLPERLHALPTRNRGEARHLAPHFDLARGWLRQAEAADEEAFEADELPPAVHREWLRDHGVGWVAVPTSPDVELHPLARAEAELAERGPIHLREAWSGEGWTLFEVVPKPGLVSRPGRVLEIEPDRVVLDLPEPGDYRLRVRWSAYWQVAGPDEVQGACLRREGDWTSVTVESPGRLEVVARLSLAGPLRREEAGEAC